MKINKVAAYTALHYGREYLPWAIRSVIKDVDEYHVLYSAQGSHSVRTDVPCPETRDELLNIARMEAGDKLRWHDGDWRQEGQQRDSIYQLTDAEMIIVVDSDEVYAPGLAAHLRALAPHYTKRHILLPFYHYWRSLKRVIKHDPAFPVRVTLPYLQAGTTTFQIPPWLMDNFRVHHFGYAITPELMRYKWQIHGHINELRKDCDWFNDVFMANRQTDCHPVGSAYWNTEECAVPDFMKDHEYANLEVIE